MPRWQARLAFGAIVCGLCLGSALAALSWSGQTLAQAKQARRIAETERMGAQTRVQHALQSEALVRQSINAFAYMLSSGAIGQSGAAPLSLEQRIAVQFSDFSITRNSNETLNKEAHNAAFTRQIQHIQFHAQLRHEQAFLRLLSIVQSPDFFVRTRRCQLKLRSAESTANTLQTRCDVEQLIVQIASTEGHR